MRDRRAPGSRGRDHALDRQLARRARAGDAAAREQLIAKHLGLAEGLARRYRGGSEPLDDLIQIARVGLVKAAARWDPERGTAFSTFAVPTMLGELRRHFRDAGWMVRPPRGLQELYLDATRVSAGLLQDVGREPTAAEVAHRLGRSTEEVLEALTAGRARNARSLDRPIDDDEMSPTTRGDALPDPRLDLRRCEDRMTLRQLSAVLNRREREIIRLRFQDDLLQREIADRIGCSQVHVSRVLREAVERMRHVAGMNVGPAQRPGPG